MEEEEKERDLLERAAVLNSLEDYRAWERQCDYFIESLEGLSRAKRPRLSVGGRQSLVARIARLESLRESTRGRFVHAGAGAGDIVWREIDTAFRGRVFTGAVINRRHIEPSRFLEDASDTVLRHVREAIGKHNAVKVNTVFNGNFVSGEKIACKSIKTKNCALFHESDLQEWYERHVAEVTLAALEEFQERDSGWALIRILNLIVNINKLNPMHLGCYVKLPRWIAGKKAIINVRSEDEPCLAWALVAALYPVKTHTEKVSSYPHYKSVLNVEGIEFPAALRHITKLERQNDISINVFAVQEREKKISPLRLTDDKRDRHVNLLYVQDKNTHHFVWIKNLSRLVGSQLTKKSNKKFICDRCLHYFMTEEKLRAHIVDCGEMNDCAIELPSEEGDDKWLRFDKYSRKERVPFVIYADLECVLEKIGEREEGEKKIQRHSAHSIAYYARCSYDDSLSVFRSNRGDDCVSWFASELHELARRVKSALIGSLPMQAVTQEQRESFCSATRCHICEKPFAPGEARVRGHCHLTGRYRGPAHSDCNLNFKDSYVIPIVFHNLSGYDAHFIIKEIATAFEGKVNLLPITKEKYISFTKLVNEAGTQWKKWMKLRFIDSYKFLSASLDNLASLLRREKFKILKSQFSDVSEEDFDLLTRKGVFPYEYVDSADKLRETRLPPREAFYSSLTGDTISESDYAHAAIVWQRFSINTLGEYSDLYLKTDVLLLADVFENFRDSCMESYGLDPAHYYTLPGFTWDAMLKHTGIVFELLTDIDMVMFVERGVRGGLSQCSCRYARANNKYMRSSYDSVKSATYLMYYDVNNLYGWAMCQPLPYGNFRWVEDVASFDVAAIAWDAEIGYILEVDLAYPAEYHDAHADIPFCPTREKPPGKRQEKLLATLYDKRRYVTHYRNLQLCLRHGLRITKIHRILEFAQSTWLRGYIELNTRLRTGAMSEFEKNLYKLMNNAVFGKTMENVRNHIDVRLLTRWDGRFGAEAMIAKPNFHSRSVFAENLIAVELRKLRVLLNKPIYVGMSILEISKIRVYEFHYEYMAPLYGERCKIMYTDTDSLIYRIECDDAYEDMKRHADKFDTSDYAPDNAYGMPLVNKKVPGLMKDENNGIVMTEFVGLRAKMYALRTDESGGGGGTRKKIKGVKGSVVERTIMFDDYVRCLEERIEMKRQQTCIRSALHEVYTVRETKIALIPDDDKRYVVPDSPHDTLPWGHYSIPL